MMYGIACYHRPQCKTLGTLLDLGIGKDEILIAVNCEEDNDEYIRRYGKSFKIIYHKKRNVAGNRNNILEELHSPCVIFDDDITAFKRYVSDGSRYGHFRKMTDGEEFRSVISECFRKAGEQRALIFGVAASDNTMIARGHSEKGSLYSLNGNFQGGFCGYLSDNIRHDESYDVLDDYELNLRMLAQGRNILRRNDIYAEKGEMGNNEGGCKELYEHGAQQRCMKRLKSQWGPLFSVIGNAKGIRITCAKVKGIS